MSIEAVKETSDTSPTSNEEVLESNQEDIDEIFLKEGPCARFQIVVQLASLYLSIAICWNFLLSTFTGDQASWKCLDNNSSTFCQANYNKTFSIDDDNFYHRCKLQRSEWTFTAPRNYSFVTEFDLVCEKTSFAALVSASYYIGGLIGSIVSGTVADNFGRKPVLLVSILANICSSIGGSFVTSIWGLFCINIVVGAASVGCFFTVFVYQLEFVSPPYRAICSSLSQLSMSLSFILLAGVAYYVRHWRLLKIYTSLPCILSAIVFAFLPESPRWLLSTGNVSKAKSVMDKILKFNGNRSHATHLKCPNVPLNKSYTYCHLLRNRKLLLLTLHIGNVWFALAVIAYSLASGTSNLGGNIYETFAISCLADFPSFLIAPYISNHIGRKKSTLGGISTAGFLVGCMSLVPKSLHCRYYINLGLSMVARFFNTTAFIVAYSWTFELFPTPLRSQGMSICVVFERVGITLVPFITRVLQSVSYRVPFIIVCVLGLLSSLNGLMLPETNNKPTLETYEDFFENHSSSSSPDSGLDNVACESVERDEQSV